MKKSQRLQVQLNSQPLRKQITLNKQIPAVTEITVFKPINIMGYFCIIAMWSFGSFLVKRPIINGALVGFIIYLPCFLSAAIMRIIKKPIIKFDVQGFYYTPQIWSMRRLYKWDDITEIEIRDASDESRCKATFYLRGRRAVSINVGIIPISYKELLQIFRYRLNNIPIKVRP